MSFSLTYVGSATTVMRLGADPYGRGREGRREGFTLLTDPNFLHRGQRAYLGYGLWSRRRTEPAAQPGDLPAYDAVVLSHMHGDHFDRVAREELEKDLPIATTPRAARRLRRWGFTETVPLAPWEYADLTRDDQVLRVTSVPARHGSRFLRRLLPATMGSVLELVRPGLDPVRVYITGDTLFSPMLGEVTERLGPLDAMLVHLGGARILGLLLTMDGKQGADLVELLRPPITVPLHFDDYPVFRSPLRDFIRETNRRGLSDLIRPVRRGETISFVPDRERQYASEPWPG
jgi:L-ascorbate metabolism protein UlaG (beta-lactamase superfamily)